MVNSTVFENLYEVEVYSWSDSRGKIRWCSHKVTQPPGPTSFPDPHQRGGGWGAQVLKPAYPSSLTIRTGEIWSISQSGMGASKAEISDWRLQSLCTDWLQGNCLTDSQQGNFGLVYCTLLSCKYWFLSCNTVHNLMIKNLTYDTLDVCKHLPYTASRNPIFHIKTAMV